MAAAYPPDRHLLRDLRLEIRRGADGIAVRAPAVPEVCGPAGGAGAAVQGIALDVLGGNVAIEVVRPDWVLTASLELHRLRPTPGDRLAWTGRALRAGRTQVVVEAEVGGPPGAEGPAAVGSVSFTRIARREDTPAYETPQARTAFAIEGSGLAAPLREALGIRAGGGGPGALEMDVGPWVRNSVGALQGGAAVALVDAAASDAAAPLLPGVPRPETLDLRVHFLALGRAGPIRARATVLGRSPADVRARIDLVDAGQEGRLVASAFARVGALEAG